MSLRSRVFLAIAAALMASVMLGGALAGWRARRSVLAELGGALEAAERTVRAGMADAVLAPDPRADARRLVEAFAPNRHVDVRLLGEAASRPAASNTAPGWFAELIAPALAPVEVVAPADAGPLAIRLEADPRNEVAEVWQQFRDMAAALALFCALAAPLGAWAIQQALRPIDRVASGLSLVGGGDYSARLPDGGASDLRPLVHGFNRMAALLEEARGRNARLSEQVLALQEEERAELAGDLHDDIGPGLFAVSLTAATIGQLAAASRAPVVAAHAATIGEVTAQMQRSVKSLLGRLRPVRATEGGLRPAMDGLVTFWRERNPEIDFDLRITADEAALDERRRETIFLVVQEAVVNAIRHGQPARIGIAVAGQPGAVTVAVTDDGRGTASREPPGFGLGLMHERVAALDGTLSVGARAHCRGWQVDARLPA